MFCSLYFILTWTRFNNQHGHSVPPAQADECAVNIMFGTFSIIMIITVKL